MLNKVIAAYSCNGTDSATDNNKKDKGTRNNSYQTKEDWKAVVGASLGASI